MHGCKMQDTTVADKSCVVFLSAQRSECGIRYENFYPSVLLSVCHTRELCGNGSTVDIEILFIPYDTAVFLVCIAKLRRREFRSSPQTSALKV